MLAISVLAKHDGSYLHDITMNYETEHLDWGGDAADGKINTLFIIPRKGGREVVEIAQRMDLGLNAVTTQSSVNFVLENRYEGAVTGTTLHEKKQELLEKLENKYDLFVVGNMQFDKLPAEAKFKILYQVMSGSGLVISYPYKTELKKIFDDKIEGAQDILSLVAKSGLPVKAIEQYDSKLMTTYRLGKGRIAVIDYRDNHNAHYEGLAMTARNNFSRYWQAEFENNLVLVMRTMKWAAGHQPEVTVSCSQLDAIPELEQKSQKVEIAVANPHNKKGHLEIRIRDEFNTILQKDNVAITATNQTVEFEIPFLPAGRYYLDMIIENDGKTDDFGYYAFTVKSPIKAELVSEKESFRHHAPVKVVLKLNMPIEKGDLIVSLFDSPYNREWYRKDISIDGMTNISFSIDEYYMPTIAGYIKCTIKQNDSVLSSVEKTLFFPDYQLESYLQLAWDCVQGQYMAPIYAKQIVDGLGWRAGLSHPKRGGTNARDAAMLNQRFVPYMVRILLEKGENGEVKQGWWHFLPKAKRPDLDKFNDDESFADPKVRQLWADGIKYRIENLPKYGPALYNLGDENHFSYDAGFGKYDTEAFHSFIKQKYGSIDKLNIEWGAEYSSFDDVPHLTLKEAKDKKIYPAWFDHRQYMEKMYADLHHFLAKEIKKYDPDAKVGAEGSIPGDLEQTINSLEFWGPYSNLVMDEVLRSIGGDRVRMLWWGGYIGSHGGRNQYPLPLWKDLLTGNVNGSAWFSSTIASAESAIGADMDYPDYMKKLIPHMSKVEDGLGQLLNETPLQKNGIAILWSHTSDSARILDSKFINPKDSMGAFIRFCHQTGLNLDFLTESMLDKLKDYKVLFLFGASALSDKECSVILEFVKNGGTVIADLNPAIANEYIRLRDNNPLHDLFGNITYAGTDIPTALPLSIDTVFRNKRLLLKSKKVSAVAGTKPFAVRHYGKGDAILLNFSLSSAGTTCSKDASLTQFLLDLLAEINVEPSVTVTGINTEDAIIRIRKGNGNIVIGLLAGKNDKGKTAVVTIPIKAYVYEPGVGYITRGKRIKIKLDKPFKLISCFEEKQLPPSIELSDNVAVPGKPLNLDLADFKDGTVLFLQMRNPTGDMLPLRKKVIIVNKDNQTYPIYFGFNDLKGNYTLVLADVASGLKSEKQIKLRD